MNRAKEKEPSTRKPGGKDTPATRTRLDHPCVAALLQHLSLAHRLLCRGSFGLAGHLNSHRLHAVQQGLQHLQASGGGGD